MNLRAFPFVVHACRKGCSRSRVLKRHKNSKRNGNMRNWICFAGLVALCLAAGGSSAQSMAAKKILIVYLSRTNNTKAVAEIIQKSVGGTLVSLELVTPYPADYHATVEQVVKENETGYLPPLRKKIDSIGNYDVVFVGFPTWDMQMPPPMKSFLKQYDLRGKTV